MTISAMTWKIAANGRLRRFDYEYDGMNRLRNAEYGYYGYMETSDNTSVFMLISNWGGEYENYSVQYWYDKNSNLTSIYRQGRLSFGDYDGYDTVEDDCIEYDGNQVVAYDPWACGDPYYSNFDFVNGADEDVEYFYDANGNLIRDLNKGLSFEYDLLGHPIKVSGSKNDIEYVYAPDGRKLRTIHKTYTSTSKKTVKTSTTKDYTNGYIFTNGKPSMFSFDGGYYSFDSQGKLNGCHYYISDYQGNNRMVVNAATNRTEQVTHYYPYGELMADISTSPDAQQFKYNGKELDRSFGLDLYDYHARQQDAKLGRFNSIDPLAHKYYWLSPYSYCGGDPVNRIDPTGMSYKSDSAGHVRYVDDKYKKTRLVSADGSVKKINEGQADALDGLISSQKENKPKGATNPTQATAKSTKIKYKDAVSLFRFLAKHSTSEWSLTGLSKTTKESSSYVFATSFQKRTIISLGLSDEDKKHVIFQIHSHPFNYYPSTNDYTAANGIYLSTLRESGQEAYFFIFMPQKDRMFQYAPYRTDYEGGSIINVNSGIDICNEINRIIIGN